MNRLEDLYRNRPDAAAFARGYLAYLTELLAQLDTAALAEFAEMLLAARERRARIFFLGNGGSAATASHFANDLSIGCKAWEEPFFAVSLSDNVPALTAIANDEGYEQVFVQQLRAQMSPGDVVVAISASGNSPNVVNALEYANANGAYTVALTGFDGGALRTSADLVVHVPTNPGEYGPTEDVHMIFDHLVSSYLAQLCASKLPNEA